MWWWVLGRVGRAVRGKYNQYIYEVFKELKKQYFLKSL